MDETYIKLNGRWIYLYRAVDKYGFTVEFLLRNKRDGVAAKAFFRKAFKEIKRPPAKCHSRGITNIEDSLHSLRKASSKYHTELAVSS